MTDDDICGHTAESTGDPCKNPPSKADNRCHIHTEAEERPNIGRDPKLTQQRQENIAQMIENGQSIAAACRCNDIGQSTFYEWLDKAEEQEEGIYADFAERVARARGAGEAKLVDELIEKCREKGDTRTLLSIIKSRYPESWGDAEATDEGGTVNIHLSPQEQEQQ